MATTENEAGPAAAVQAVVDRMMAGYARSDADMVMGCYEAEAAYAREPGHAACGPAALRRLLGEIVASNPQFRFTRQEIVLAGDLALHIAAYDAQGPDGVHRGVSVVALRRQADGTWLMVIDHPSADRLLR